MARKRLGSRCRHSPRFSTLIRSFSISGGVTTWERGHLGRITKKQRENAGETPALPGIPLCVPPLFEKIRARRPGDRDYIGNRIFWEAPESVLKISKAVPGTPESVWERAKAVPAAPEAVLQNAKAVSGAPEGDWQSAKAVLGRSEAVWRSAKAVLDRSEAVWRSAKAVLDRSEAVWRGYALMYL
jgi:hypothetical protein